MGESNILRICMTKKGEPMIGVLDLVILSSLKSTFLFHMSYIRLCLLPYSLIISQVDSKHQIPTL